MLVHKRPEAAVGCEVRFRFTANGNIFPQEDDPAAKTTIERLGLDIPKLRDLRRAAVDVMLEMDVSVDDIKGMLSTRKADGSFVEFYTTIRQVLLT